MADQYVKSPVIVASRPRPWVARGVCRGADPELFFAEKSNGQMYDSDPRVREAKAYCRQCPVSTQCLFTALRDHEHGVWGGTTPAEREDLRRWDRSVAS